MDAALLSHESGRLVAALTRIFGPHNLALSSERPFYPAAVAELELRRGNVEAARDQFRVALGLARNGDERRFLEKRLNCGG